MSSGGGTGLPTTEVASVVYAAGELNLYAAVADVRDEAGAASTNDGRIARIIHAASREVDRYCNRHFWVESETRYFDVWRDHENRYWIDDVLSVTSLQTDSEDDDTFDGETWTAGTDYHLGPDNRWPKQFLRGARNAVYSLPERAERYLKIVGLFGYGDGTRSTPYDLAGCTGTVADTTGTALVQSTEKLKAGQTVLVESEQMYVSAVSGVNATVRRAVNGTTASAHAAAAVYVYRYPADVVRVVEWMAGVTFKDEVRAGMQMEVIGDYTYQRSSSLYKQIETQMDRVLYGYRRMV